MGPMRSILSIPGNKINMIEKARQLPADVLVLDLEDSVPPAEKTTARNIVKDSLEGMSQKGQKIFVRINSLSAGLVEQELEAIIRTGLDGISIPKVNAVSDIEMVSHLLDSLEKERGIELGKIKLLPWVESAMSLLRSFDIASGSPRVIAVAFGADDFTLDMGIEHTSEGRELFYPRVVIAVAARAAGVAAIDTTHVDFKDEEGLVREAKLAKSLGFVGKYVIHPSQIGPVNEVFSPSAEEIDHARRVVEAFETAVSQGSAVATVDGKAVDTPVAERARQLLDLAASISGK